MNLTLPLHHAYIIEGDWQVNLEELKNFLEKKLKFSTQGNVDLYIAEYGKFGIDEARELIERSGQKAIGQSQKIFIITALSFTREAQNSLLKVLEEPTEDTHFFIMVPSAEILIPTLKSRVVILRGEEGSAGRAGAPESFLKANPTKRLEIVKEMLARLENEEITKTDFLYFLNEIEKIKVKEISAKSPEEERLKLEELIKMRNFLQDQSSSAKLILEYLAITL